MRSRRRLSITKHDRGQPTGSDSPPKSNVSDRLGGGGSHAWGRSPLVCRISERAPQPGLQPTGIEPLPITVAWQPNVQARLEQLVREPCYRDAVVQLANELLAADYLREATTSLLTFADRCGGAPEELPLAYEALSRVGGFRGGTGHREPPGRCRAGEWNFSILARKRLRSGRRSCTCVERLYEQHRACRQITIRRWRCLSQARARI
jgi:hypothetical protein